MCVPALGAPASALAPAHCSPANCVRWEHPLLDKGTRRSHAVSRGLPQQVSRVAVQREAMLGPLAMLRVFAACRSDVSPLG
jgi:hypothetical protein